MNRYVNLAAALVTLASAAAGAQQTVSIASAPTCGTCRLQLEHVLDIGDESGPGMVENENSWVVRDSRGRFFLLYSYATSIKVYDARGRFLSVIGRKGGGPGEFEGISGVYITRGDSIHVLDYNRSRRSVFGPDLKYVRSTPLAMSPQMHSVVLNDGYAVVNLNARSPSLVGLPMHTLDTLGRIERSFGSETGVYRPDIPGLTRRVLAPHRGPEVWVAHERSYQIERWDARSGKLTAKIVRGVSWFPNGETPRAREWDGGADPPEPAIVRVHEDSLGRLWVLSSVADRRWKSAVSAGEPGHFAIKDFTQYYDFKVDVIDWKRGLLLASWRQDAHPGYFIGSNMMAGLVSERNGRVVIPVFKASIQGLPRQ